VIDFDGGDVVYAAAGTFWELTAETEDLSLIVVARPTAAASGQDTIVTTRQAAIQGGFQMSFNTGANGRWYVYDSGGAASTLLTYAGGTQNVVHTLAGLLGGAASPATDAASAWLDGASVASSAPDLGIVEAAADREFCVGGTSTTAGSFVGQLAEIILHHGLLSAGEDASLTSYLNDRYGLSLPGVTL
jgi:hypothetical protein